MDEFDREFSSMKRKANVVFWVVGGLALLFSLGILTILGLAVRWAWTKV
jgi:hypothetical protein